MKTITQPKSPGLEALVKEARADYQAGKTSGPFSSSGDLIKHLDS